MKKASFLLVITFLSACQPVVNSRGNVIIEDNIASFVVGKTTSAEVLEKCGTPSLHRDNFTWIYIGGISEEIAFKSVQLKDRFIVRIKFNKDKILESIEKIKPREDDRIATEEEITNLISDEQVTTKVENMLSKN